MKNIVSGCILGCLLMVMINGAAQSEDKTSIANLMIKTDMPLSASEDQKTIAESQLYDIYKTINEKKLGATVFATQDFISSHARLRLTDIGLSSNFELAISGNNSNEKLSTESFEKQKSLLETSKRYVESCRVCGENEIMAMGFMPQSFDQNEDTYKALDSLGIQYDAGFQAGLLYTPGHEKDVWPYMVEGYKFYAVPVSTYTMSGKEVVLDDAYFKDNDLSASNWYDALAGKFDQIQGKDEPLVVSLTTSVSGSGDYLEALNKFLNYAVSKNAKFVTTTQLVNMTKDGAHYVSALPSSRNTSVSCPTCDQSNSIANVAITLENATQAAASKNTATSE